MAYDYETIDCTSINGILTATLNNPPVNVMSLTLYQDLAGFTAEVAQDDDVKVVVFQSANPGFFIAHFDVELILAFPSEGEPEKATTLNEFHQMCMRLRTMPKATIAKIAGRAGGGGNE
ncbi:MAG: enoyl-CoA hydratase/isomerase family protein, partial [Pseudomonadales bacterium]